jgi:hypothetical protein
MLVAFLGTGDCTETGQTGQTGETGELPACLGLTRPLASRRDAGGPDRRRAGLSCLRRNCRRRLFSASAGNRSRLRRPGTAKYRRLPRAFITRRPVGHPQPRHLSPCSPVLASLPLSPPPSLSSASPSPPLLSIPRPPPSPAARPLPPSPTVSLTPLAGPSYPGGPLSVLSWRTEF